MFINAKVIGDGVSYETYHRQDARRGDQDYSMSRSELVTFAKCPKRWLDGFRAADESTSSTDWGNLIDALLTSPDKFDSMFAITPEFYTNKKGEKSEWRNDQRIAEVAEFLNSNKNKTIIKAPLKKEADVAVRSIRESQFLEELFSISRKQVFVLGQWSDRETGLEIPVRGLIDLVPPGDHPVWNKTLGDLKTARNGDPAFWPRVVDDQGYDVQAALFLDLYVAATGEDRTDFVHVVQENVFPFHVVNPLPSMSAEFLDWGRMKYQRALRLYSRCLATGDWPSYEPAGLHFRGTQIISPDGLWSYRQSAGDSRLATVATHQPKPESCDLIL